jgi:oxalate decarboxylase family bicupin protein
LSKNFDLPLSAWDNIPPGELFIFPGTKAPKDISEQNIVGPGGIVPLKNSYTYHASKQQPNFSLDGGSVKIIDPTVFPLAAKFSTAIVTVKPGALREIHWHTTSDEWNFFISGSARIGIYAAANAAQTFDFNAGDCGYIPKAMTHYVENTGDDDVVFIEVLQADHFSGKTIVMFHLPGNDINTCRYLCGPMARANSTPNRHGHVEFDECNRFLFQAREAIYREEYCSR